MRFGMGLKITSESKQNNIPQESFGQGDLLCGLSLLFLFPKNIFSQTNQINISVLPSH